MLAGASCPLAKVSLLIYPTFSEFEVRVRVGTAASPRSGPRRERDGAGLEGAVLDGVVLDGHILTANGSGPSGRPERRAQTTKARAASVA